MAGRPRLKTLAELESQEIGSEDEKKRREVAPSLQISSLKRALKLIKIQQAGPVKPGSARRRKEWTVK
jgi:hypothetical protein